MVTAKQLWLFMQMCFGATIEMEKTFGESLMDVDENQKGKIMHMSIKKMHPKLKVLLTNYAKAENPNSLSGGFLKWKIWCVYL